jgi:hypothetical protein
MCGWGDITATKETNTTGRRAGGRSLRANMRYGSLTDTRTAMMGTFTPKATGGSASLCAPVVI